MTGPTWTVGDDVGWVSDETTEAVYVALLPLAPPLVLDGTARLIWLAAVEGHTLSDVVSIVATATRVDRDIVRDDTTTFLDDLVSRRLLVRHGA